MPLRQTAHTRMAFSNGIMPERLRFAEYQNSKPLHRGFGDLIINDLQFEIGQGAAIIFTPTEGPKGLSGAITKVGRVDHIGLHHFTIQTHFLQTSRSQESPLRIKSWRLKNGFDAMFFRRIPLERHFRQPVSTLKRQTRRRAAAACECGLKPRIAMLEVLKIGQSKEIDVDRRNAARNAIQGVPRFLGPKWITVHALRIHTQMNDATLPEPRDLQANRSTISS